MATKEEMSVSDHVHAYLLNNSHFTPVVRVEQYWNDVERVTREQCDYTISGLKMAFPISPRHGVPAGADPQEHAPLFRARNGAERDSPHGQLRLDPLAQEEVQGPPRVPAREDGHGERLQDACAQLVEEGGIEQLWRLHPVDVAGMDVDEATLPRRRRPRKPLAAATSRSKASSKPKPPLCATARAQPSPRPWLVPLRTPPSWALESLFPGRRRSRWVWRRGR